MLEQGPNPEQGPNYELALAQALEIIEEADGRASSSEGFYRERWARDFGTTALGASLYPRFRELGRETLRLFSDHQRSDGCIPNNVSIDTGESNWRAYMDGNMWYVLGHSMYGDNEEFTASSWESIEKALSFVDAQDKTGEHLVSIDEGANWMDLMPVHGASIHDNVLYIAALEAAAKMAAGLAANGYETFDAKSKIYEEKAKKVREKVQQVLWQRNPSNPDDIEKDIYQQHRLDLRKPAVLSGLSSGEVITDVSEGEVAIATSKEEKQLLTVRNRSEKSEVLRESSQDENRYFAWYSTGQGRYFNDRFDMAGNLLAILYDVASEDQAASILDFIEEQKMDQPYPGKALWPPIQEEDKDWSPYMGNEGRNLPGWYHNGGHWPWIAALEVMANVKAGRIDQAEALFAQLTVMNLVEGEAGGLFCEHFNDKTGGVRGDGELMAWNAGTYLAAKRAVETGHVRTGEL